ncbi:MAG: hypothetical protein JXC32_20615 [Anaerolineae bacterium]|nr:hypothetical protein [Anaerolineae bacterium]
MMTRQEFIAKLYDYGCYRVRRHNREDPLYYDAIRMVNKLEAEILAVYDDQANRIEALETALARLVEAVTVCRDGAGDTPILREARTNDVDAAFKAAREVMGDGAEAR